MTAAVTRTEHGSITAVTAVHDLTFEHRLGGVRFVERGSVEEVRHLAAGMAEKCAASRVPLGGQKTLVICPDGVPTAPGARAAILAAHIRHAMAEWPGGVFGPDMSCGSDVLDLVAEMPDVGANVTGLSAARQGLDISKRAFTARGVVRALDRFLRVRDATVSSAVVQGFGTVGAPIAVALAERGICVRAVSNQHGVVIDADGVDVSRVFELWRARGDDCLAAFARERPDATFTAEPDALFDVRADVFVPSARTTVLALASELDACRDENRDVRSVEEFARTSQCRVVLEAANHPLTPTAEEYLEQCGVAVLPDVLINIGGMVGCYAEWRYRHLLRRGDVSLDDLAARCHAYTAGRVDENVFVLLAADGSSRCAATSIVRRNRAALLTAGSSTHDLLGLER